MNRFARGVLVVSVCVFASRAAGQAPKVASTVPKAGATDVDPGLGEIVVTFDTPVKMNSYSLVLASKGILPELVGDKPITFRDNKTCVVKVKLAPNTEYGLGFNSKTRQGFKSAADGTPAVPFELRFKTGSGKPKPAADGPRVLKTEPANGAKGMEAGTFDLKIVFSEPMQKGKASIMTPPAGPRLKTIGAPRWDNATTFVVPLLLDPAKTYRIGINTGEQKRFVSAGDGTPAVRFELTFSTASAKAEPDKAKPGPKGPMRLTYKYQKGDVGRIEQWNIVDIKIKLDDGRTIPVKRKIGMMSIEEVLAAEDGMPAEVQKLISEYILLTTNEQTGEDQAAPRLEEGVMVKINRRVDPPTAETLKGNPPQELMAILAEDYFPDVAPKGPISVGKTATFPEETLQYLRAEFGTKPGQKLDIKLACKRIGPRKVEDARNKMFRDKGGGEPVTYVFDAAEFDIAWRQEGNMPNGVPFTLTAKGGLAFAIEAGIVLELKIDGKIAIQRYQTQDDNGRPIQLTGDGVYKYEYTYQPIDWKRGLAGTTGAGGASGKGEAAGSQDKTQETEGASKLPSKGTDAFDAFMEESYQSPQRSILMQHTLLHGGHVDRLKTYFTERLRGDITAEAVKAGQEAIKEYTIDQLIDRVLVDDEKGLAKIKMENGRTLTTLKRVDGKWLSDTIWFK